MKITALPFAVTGLALALAGFSPAQSPWAQEQGGGFLQFSGYVVQYDELYSGGGSDYRTSREITDATVEAYGEFGLTENLTLLGRVPFKLQDAGDPVAGSTLPPTTESGSLTRFGNLGLGIKHQWVSESFALSGQFDIEFPTGTFDDRTGLRTGYDAFTFAPTVSIGRGFGEAYGFAYGGLGFRTNDYSHYWRLGAEGGYRFFERLTLAIFLDAVQSFENGDVILPPSNLETGLYVNDQEWVAWGIKGLWDIGDSFGLQATAHSAFDGNNVPKAVLFGIGFYFDW